MEAQNPGPPRVQIQTQAGCNGRCVFCPNEAVLKSGMPHGKMSESLFRKIIDDLAQTPPRRISLYLMNEPLNDKRLPDFVRYTAERIPETTTLVTSNGTRLTEERAEALIAAGLKRLKVSLQSLDPKRNEEIMGYSSEPVVENILGVKRAMKRMKARNFDFRVSMVVTAQNHREIEKARRFWRRHGVRLVTSSLENRGGNIILAEEMNLGAMENRTECIRPSREMCILYSGDVVLCCVDWFRTVTAGNVGERSLQEVWNSDVFRRVRTAFSDGDVASLPSICVNCTESACPSKHRRGIRGMLSRLVGVN